MSTANGIDFGPRVLVVKVGALGDAVMALPLITRLIGRARVTIIAGRGATEVFRCFAPEAEIITVDEAWLLAGTLRQRLSALCGVWQKTVGVFFEEVYILHKDWRYRALPLVARAGKTIVQKGLKCAPGVPEGRHMADEFAGLDSAYDIVGSPVAELPCLQMRWPDQLPAVSRPYICIAPGGARNTLRNNDLRRWPLQYYRSVAAWAIRNGVNVCLIGAASDAWVRSGFQGLRLNDFLGRTSVTDIVVIAQRSLAFVTHDSGPMHLAALSGTQVLAIFGPTSREQFGWRFSRVHNLVARVRPACSPCYDGREFASCGNNVCLQAITPDVVIERLGYLLAAGNQEVAKV